MKTNSLTLAALILTGLFATGCQQMQQAAGSTSQQLTGASQQTTQQTAAATTPATETSPVTPAKPAAGGNTHTHPAIPGCTNSTTHSHPYTDPNHKHSYGCKGGVPKAAGKGGRPAMPKVKAKGHYRGPVMMDDASKDVMRDYQKN